MTTPETKTLHVRLFYHDWQRWCVTVKDYDCKITENGYRGSHIESGNTPEEAIQNYQDYLTDEGEENFELEVTGPSIEIEHRKYFV